MKIPLSGELFFSENQMRLFKMPCFRSDQAHGLIDIW